MTLATKLRLPPENRILVAVSGGQDSMALLHMLYGTEKEVLVWHGDHHTEGSFDRRIVVQKYVADELGLAFFTNQYCGHKTTEVAWRDWRYAELYEAARNLCCAAVVTGHTQTDQAETILHNLCRGTGINGMSGIPYARPLGEGVTLYRPMLDINRVETAQYCLQNNLRLAIDPSNEDQSYSRNRLRLSVCPELEKVREGAVETIGRTAKKMSDTNKGLTELLDDRLLVLSTPYDFNLTAARKSFSRETIHLLMLRWIKKRTGICCGESFARDLERKIILNENSYNTIRMDISSCLTLVLNEPVCVLKFKPEADND